MDKDAGFLPENFVDYRLVPRAETLEEVRAVGFMSDFHPMFTQISADKSEFILVIVDRQQVYGDSWRVCLTAEAQTREMAQIEAQEAEKKALDDAIAAEKARLEEQQRAAETAVYEDKPFTPRPYASATMAETADDVAALTIQPERPLINYTLIRPLDSFGHAVNFADRSAENEKYIEHRAQKNPDFELNRREADISLQASPAVDSVHYDDWEEWTEEGICGAGGKHRRRIWMDLDETTRTEFYFINNVWYAEEDMDKDGDTSLADVAEVVKDAADVVVYNMGWWQLKDCWEDYMCGAEGFDETCAAWYEGMMQEVLDNLLAFDDDVVGIYRIWEKHPCFETVPRDDRSSKNQPKRVETGRDMSL